MDIFNREIWFLLIIMVLICSNILNMVAAKKNSHPVFYRVGMYVLMPLYGGSFIFGVLAAMLPISPNQLWFKEIYLVQCSVLIIGTMLYMLGERILENTITTKREL